MPKVYVRLNDVEQQVSTPESIDFDVLVDGKKLQYRLVLQDEGLILEETIGENDSLTLAQVQYCDYARSMEDWVQRFTDAGVTDLDAEVYEMKAIEVTAINNAGLAPQLEFLLKSCGEDYLRGLLGEESP